MVLKKMTTFARQIITNINQISYIISCKSWTSDGVKHRSAKGRPGAIRLAAYPGFLCVGPPENSFQEGQEGQEGRKTQKPKSERRAFIRQKIDFFFHERKGRMLGRRLELLKWARANGCPPRAPPRQRECERTLM